MRVSVRAHALLAAAAFLSCGPGDTRPGADSAVSDLISSVTGSITVDDLASSAEAIIAHERPSGSPGESEAIDYVVRTLQDHEVPVEVHTFEGYASDPVSARVEVPESGLSFEAITMSFSASVPLVEGPLVDMGTLSDLPSLEPGTGERLVLPGEGMESPFARGYPDLSGTVALVDGQPRNEPVTVLSRLGAAAVIFANPEERLNELIVTSTWGTPSLLNYHRIPDIPVAQVRKSAGDALRALRSQGSLRVRVGTEVQTGWKTMRLAVARIPGPAGDAPYVLFGGHIDAWHHGATDEGASNAAMLELALAFHAQRHRLRRGLVVAWWPGHSNARYAGSTWFADHFFDELRQRAVAYVNVDLIGQIGASRFSASASASLAALASRVIREATGAEVKPTVPGRNSDQSFNGIGLPLLQLNHGPAQEDGGAWWWHTTEDDLDKVDFQVLKTDADLYARALAHLLAEPVLPLEPSSEVRALGVILKQSQDRVGERFDLREPMASQAQLLQTAGKIEEALPAEGDAQLDRALVRMLRPLTRVMYVPISPYHPDPGVAWQLLPGLSPLSILEESDPSSRRHRFALASLVRERNRLLEALAQSEREAQELLGSLGRD